MIGLGNFILWIVIGTFAAICLFILVLLARLMLRRNARSYPAPSAASPHQAPREIFWLIVAAAIVAVPLVRLLYLENTSPAADVTIKVTGKMWAWTYQYPDNGNFSFDAPMMLNAAAGKAGDPNPAGTDNHIVVPVGKTVRIVTTGTNVVYSWAIPSIGAQITALPGRTSQSWFTAGKEGRYYGECSELCGLPHVFKPVEVEVVSVERFDRWVAEARARLAAAGAPTRVADQH